MFLAVGNRTASCARSFLPVILFGATSRTCRGASLCRVCGRYCGYSSQVSSSFFYSPLNRETEPPDQVLLSHPRTSFLKSPAATQEEGKSFLEIMRPSSRFSPQ